MNLLPILFWVLLVLYAIGAFVPAWQRPSVFAVVILLVLVGLRVFPVVLN